MENKKRLAELEELFLKFQTYQQEIEDIVKADMATAKEWLGTRAAPTAFAIKERLGKMASSQREFGCAG
jgi:hypothetical protein